MKKQITQIRDIEQIEKQISKADSGILCIHLSNEKLFQLACNFVYLDKNIYAYLDNTDENYEHVKYGALGSFSVSNSEKLNDKSSGFTYKLSSITINGEIKDVDDSKIADQICELYRQKYSSSIRHEKYLISENLKLVILDSNEIKAIIEEGI